MISKIKNLAPLGSTRVIFLTFSKYSDLYISWCRQNSRITDKQTYVLNLSETWLYMVHFRPGLFFENRQKNCLHRFTIKVNQKVIYTVEPRKNELSRSFSFLHCENMNVLYIYICMYVYLL